jgi:Fe-S-cluster containining protein
MKANDPMTDKSELESQAEAGALFMHSALSAHADRINRVEAFVYGLADALLDGGQVTEEQLRTRAASVAEELKQKGEMLSAGVVLRVDADPPPAASTVDCGARMHVCKAVCCRLSFPLSAPEIEGGRIRWELGKPYFARKDATGCCVHLDEKNGCSVYQNRPRVCRSYSCAKDERIWTDFDRMILNQEWIDQNLGPERPQLIAVRMDRIS